ncbi:MAG: peptidoglycan DD-metalloendopeptidase family protein, partial [Proteobacteria bacterium]|nr:peptidoglycan DD-metalloendopeptidase family protein [Pseudomonadota bacterium]
LVQQQQALREAHIRLSSLQEEKRRVLTERQEQLERVRREAEEIAKSAPDLPSLLQKYDEVVLRQAKEALAQAPEPPPAAVPPKVPPPGPLASAEPAKPAAKAVPQEPAPAVVLAPKGGLKIASLNSGRIKPAIAFADAKGRLPLPVQGKRLIAFGDKTHASRSSGIVIETRAGAQVVSPTDGWVVFAGVFRSYGQILIINAGDGYHMLLAGLSQIDVQLGQFVLAGEPVGLMSGAPLGAKPKPVGNAPVLYIELRKDGRSIDPDPWWASEGTQKVQG